MTKSKLQAILEKAKEGMQPWESIPESAWPVIAEQCHALEVEELKRRIYTLNHELNNIEEWDGDTQDDIHKTIYFFEQLIKLNLNYN